MLVTIDGPAGAGKSTLAKLMADRLHWDHIDSGALYRAAALLLEKEQNDHEISLSDMAAKVHDADIRFIGDNVYIGSRDVSALIRTSHIDEKVSAWAIIGAFRSALTEVMRRHAEIYPNAIIDGRDIGSVVFPDADLKIYLDAALEIRARRRLAERPGRGVDEMMNELRRRDRRDSERIISPMIIPSGALVVDTSRLTEIEVLERVMRHLQPLLARAK